MGRNLFVRHSLYVLLSMTALPAWSAPLCQDVILGERVAVESLQGDAQQFFKNLWTQTLGEANLRAQNIEIRQQDASTYDVRIAGENRTLRVSWKDGTISPEIKHDDKMSTLEIPRNYNFAETLHYGKDWVQKLSIYSKLHPFTASAKVNFSLKEVQREAVQAVDIVSKSNQSSFLFVAPTGVGKTVVMMEVMKKRLSQPSKLHVIAADQNFITDQLSGNLAKLKEHYDFEIEVWGNGKSENIQDYLQKVNARSKPTVLVTTIQTLNSKIDSGAGREANIASLREQLSTFAFDEAHHLGAPETISTLKSLKQNNAKLFLYGTTATPIHMETSILKLFDTSFWAYIDKPNTFLQNGKATERLVGDTVQQLMKAIDRGELSPLESFKVVQAEGEGFTMFSKKAVQGDGVRYVIEPTQFPRFLENTRDAFLKHDKGFITVGTVSEANTLAEFLNAQNLGKKFTPLHTGMPDGLQKDTLASFKRKDAESPNFLITVRKLDEGVDIPTMSLYVDANRSVGPRQFLQRLGRTLRLSPEKKATEVIVLSEVNELALVEGFHDIQKKVAGKTEYTPAKISSAKARKSVSFLAEKDQSLALKLIHFFDITARIEGDGLGRMPRQDAPTTSSENAIYAGLSGLQKAGPQKVEAFLELLPPSVHAMVKDALFPAKTPEQWVQATDRFIQATQRAPKMSDVVDITKLDAESQHVVALRNILGSDKGDLFWRSLSDLSRKTLREAGLGPEMMTIDQLLNQFVATYHRLPSVYFNAQLRAQKPVDMDPLQARFEEALYQKYYRAVTYGEARLGNLSPEANNLVQQSRIYADLVRSLPRQASDFTRLKPGKSLEFGMDRFSNRVYRRMEMSSLMADKDANLTNAFEKAQGSLVLVPVQQ